MRPDLAVVIEAATCAGAIEASAGTVAWAEKTELLSQKYIYLVAQVARVLGGRTLTHWVF